ncbi:hypothetical protein [Terrisporobacter sp.]
MAKRRRIKKSVILVGAIILFFIVYFAAFMMMSKKEKKDENNSVKIESREDNRSLLKQLESKEKVYLSDQAVSDVRVDEQLLEELRYSFEDVSKIRTPGSYTSVYEGYSDDGLKFSTDLNVIRIYTVNKEEYYKIPVASKDEFKKILDKSIYTSFDFVRQYKTWKEVKISYNNDVKKLSRWKYDDLANTMASKRVVGKVQPERNKERCKYNFVIEIKADNYEAKIYTMGEDYVKIEAKNLSSYYEVHNGLYKYIKNEIFKI